MHIIGNYYHIYNRGAHKEVIFRDAFDYARFWALLYVANDTKRLRQGWTNYRIWPNYERDVLVHIFAYCLMPNHYHIGLIEIKDNGIKKFIQKISTAYTMYFNTKYDHSGTIFQGRYKYKHVNMDDYLRYLIEYIHLNPYGIEEPDISKYAKEDNLAKAIQYSKEYEYSSFKDYNGVIRPQNNILVIRGPHLV